MTDLSDLVEAYKRELALPGMFDQQFPGVSEAGIIGSLADAFGAAQLDGYFRTMVLDVDAETVLPDLSVAGAALVVLYAGIRATRQQVQAQAQSAKYKAGPVAYETATSASVLAEALKALEARRKELLENALYGRGTATFMLEGYQSRGSAHNFYGGLFDYELALPNWSL